MTPSDSSVSKYSILALNLYFYILFYYDVKRLFTALCIILLESACSKFDK